MPIYIVSFGTSCCYLQLVIVLLFDMCELLHGYFFSLTFLDGVAIDSRILIDSVMLIRLIEPEFTDMRFPFTELTKIRIHVL